MTVPVRVAVRCRPLLAREGSLGENGNFCVECVAHKASAVESASASCSKDASQAGAGSVLVRVPACKNRQPQQFYFDYVFPPVATQAQVYTAIAAPLLDGLFKGVPCILHSTYYYSILFPPLLCFDWPANVNS